MADVTLTQMADVTLTQLVAANWDDPSGRRWVSLFGLGPDGAVYRRAAAAGGWVKVSMRLLTEEDVQVEKERRRAEWAAKSDRGGGTQDENSY